jgi:hypothetical protein
MIALRLAAAALIILGVFAVLFTFSEGQEPAVTYVWTE